MKQKQIFLTNYRKGWIAYKKTDDYKRLSNLLKGKGVNTPTSQPGKPGNAEKRGGYPQGFS